MNRKQRRHPGKARRAALALLVAGTLAVGGTPVAQADAATLAGDLVIHGGGGGGGWSGSVAGGGGGGAYVEYWEGGTRIAHEFGGGGGPYGPALDGSIGGGAGGGGGISGGRSGDILSGKGNGTTAVADATFVGSGVPASQSGTFPADIQLVSVGRGDDGSSATGGAGGSAEVKATNLNLNSLTLFSGEAGQAPSSPSGMGGAGGSVTFTADRLNAKTIALNQDYGYDQPPGDLSFTVGTLVAGLDYSLTVSAGSAPSIEIGGFEFDLTGAANGSTLLTYGPSAQEISSSTPLAFAGVPQALQIGDTIALIDGVLNDDFAPRTMVFGDYTFEVSISDSTLVATVTFVTLDTPDVPDNTDVPKTGDSNIKPIIGLLIAVAVGAWMVCAGLMVRKRPQQ